MSDTALAILQILFPPDGAILASLVDYVPQIHSHKWATIRLPEGGA